MVAWSSLPPLYLSRRLKSKSRTVCCVRISRHRAIIQKHLKILSEQQDPQEPSRTEINTCCPSARTLDPSPIKANLGCCTSCATATPTCPRLSLHTFSCTLCVGIGINVLTSLTCQWLTWVGGMPPLSSSLWSAAIVIRIPDPASHTGLTSPLLYYGLVCHISM